MAIARAAGLAALTRLIQPLTSAAPGLGLDLDEQARVDERPDLDHRRRRADGPEHLAVAPATASAGRESVTNIRVRTTSARAEPGLAEGRLDDREGRPCLRGDSPGWVERPSAPASVVPATQQPSPTAIARL